MSDTLPQPTSGDATHGVDDNTAGQSIGETSAAVTPKLPDGMPLVNKAVKTKRIHRTITARRVATVDVKSGRWHDHSGRPGAFKGDQLRDVLENVRSHGWIVVCDDQSVPMVRSWANQAPPEGWQIVSTYVDDRHPCIDVQHVGQSTKVRISTGQQWTGTTLNTERTGEVLRRLRGTIETVWRRERGTLMVTPATTGRDLMARCLPDDLEWPVLSDELAELIRTDAGQHRIEMVMEPGRRVDMVELDARLAYASGTWQLPVGEPERVIGEPADPLSRWRGWCRWSCPLDWTAPGLLPCRVSDGWRWPVVPGGRFLSWLDGSEVHLARQWGWRVEVIEHVAWPKGPDPLRTWTQRLVNIYQDTHAAEAAEELHPEVAKGLRAAVRSIFLHALGALQGRRQAITRQLPVDRISAVPEEGQSLQLSEDETHVIWTELRDPAWPELVRPEWTACIWARMRCRVMDAPGARPRGWQGTPPRTGALHLPDGIEVVAFAGDAIYTTGDPGWADDGQVGRFRTKGVHPGLVVPATMPDLHQLRRQGAGEVGDYTAGAAKARQAWLASKIKGAKS